MIFKRTEIVAILLGCILIITSVYLLVAFMLSKQTKEATSLNTETAIAPTSEVSTPDTETTSTTTSTTTDMVEAKEIEMENKPIPKPEAKPANMPETKPAKPKEPTVEPVVVETPVATKVATLNTSTMLQAHNSVRVAHGLPALAWSNKLAASAKAWSEVLKGESCKMRHDYNSLYGENIFWKNQSGGDISSLLSSENEPVKWWAAEERYFDYENNSCDPGQQCGHYTQLVWADTTEVGCGVSSCIKGDSRTDIWVCRYNPPGNVEGELPY